METKSQNGKFLSLPLLAEYDQVDKAEKGIGSDSVIITGKTSFLKTTFHGLNALSGVGILSTPYALSSGGWLSMILLLVIACVTFYTSLLIKRCMNFDPTIRSYPDIGDRAFGKAGRILVSVFMNLELYLVATGFLILAGDNLHNLLPEVNFGFWGLTFGGKQSFVLIVALVILPTVLLKNMSILAYVSASAVLASLVIIGSIFWTAMYDGIGFNKKGILVNWGGFPTSLSLYAFCYCGHPVFPTLYTSMKNQKQFSKVMLLCFLFATTTYASIAAMGYSMFGSDVETQITLNLPTEKFSSKLAIYTALISPIAKYALMMTPIVNRLEEHFQSYNDEGSSSFSPLIRTTLVMSSVIIALAIPFFGYLMSLVGAFLSVTASILLPCLCYLKISGTYKKLGFELVIIGLTVLMGLLILVTGTYTSLIEIIQHF
ncbi:PREDICTED: vacuolar amino acid transporter 1-like [Nicotiana attenuata]|uniref:Amino acid transporter antl1 n=1 Tax=Nicotiana attenuata TaxID=49451 RepID=A0A314KN15_NICAT|nr:PREDICTED: vacuolar amino acid transporter 1-like [Nicotiana attenuata]OIT30683.1 amino acid transporter antl1 [Nicotiana attenuata]